MDTNCVNNLFSFGIFISSEIKREDSFVLSFSISIVLTSPVCATHLSTVRNRNYESGTRRQVALPCFVRLFCVCELI